MVDRSFSLQASRVVWIDPANHTTPEALWEVWHVVARHWLKPFAPLGGNEVLVLFFCFVFCLFVVVFLLLCVSSPHPKLWLCLCGCREEELPFNRTSPSAQSVFCVKFSLILWGYDLLIKHLCELAQFSLRKPQFSFWLQEDPTSLQLISGTLVPSSMQLE